VAGAALKHPNGIRRFVVWVFLRQYAMALSRTFRNTPDQACNDAITRTGIVLAGPLGSIVYAIFAVLASGERHSETQDPLFLATAIGSIVIMMVWIRSCCAPYREQPDAAALYRSKSQRLRTTLISLLILLSLPIVIGFGLQHFAPSIHR
jgi:hypothetical protein